jgi:hypothetical protein
MKKTIRLTESEFHNLVRRLVKEAQEEMMDVDVNMETEEEEGNELSKSDVVDLISKFFKKEVLPDLDASETAELKSELGEKEMSQLSEMYLNENLKDRMSNFKEKAMMKGGLGMAAMGLIGSLGEITGWSEHEMTLKIHDFVQSFGAGNYSGPITLAMVAAGLAMALKGRAMKYNRTGQ